MGPIGAEEVDVLARNHLTAGKEHERESIAVIYTIPEVLHKPQ